MEAKDCHAGEPSANLRLRPREMDWSLVRLIAMYVPVPGVVCAIHFSSFLFERISSPQIFAGMPGYSQHIPMLFGRHLHRFRDSGGNNYARSKDFCALGQHKQAQVTLSSGSCCTDYRWRLAMQESKVLNRTQGSACGSTCVCRIADCVLHVDRHHNKALCKEKQMGSAHLKPKHKGISALIAVIALSALHQFLGMAG